MGAGSASSRRASSGTMRRTWPMLRVTINREPYECPEGVTVLQAQDQLGIEIPSLCHDNRLTPYGACRLCIVKIAGSVKPSPACTTPLTEGMEIETHPPRDRSAATVTAAASCPGAAAARRGTPF
jgi:predicted molibdopterin-dependent oxidoreductase YjgC